MYFEWSIDLNEILKINLNVLEKYKSNTKLKLKKNQVFVNITRYKLESFLWLKYHKPI